ncbi:hypothetical protein KK2020170_11660 [Flavobacterium okayamense]|uniref:Uncharacterized protein n=1 Tax=Flavobacterium okayamense TaxID=2830782 RepID=A0ABM7S688_9FLAO|nr:hypothetical protein KK2020170_11660 [Flavobacterium okayamense]
MVSISNIGKKKIGKLVVFYHFLFDKKTVLEDKISYKGKKYVFIRIKIRISTYRKIL